MRKPYICVAKQGIQQIIRTAGEDFFFIQILIMWIKKAGRDLIGRSGLFIFLRRLIRWSQKRRDKMDRTRAKNFSTPIIIYIYIHIYFLFNNYCTLWLYVYKALNIRRLGRDKTGVKNWVQFRVIVECSRNPFFAFFPKSSIFGTGFQFSIPNRTQKKRRRKSPLSNNFEPPYSRSFHRKDLLMSASGCSSKAFSTAPKSVSASTMHVMTSIFSPKCPFSAFCIRISYLPIAFMVLRGGLRPRWLVRIKCCLSYPLLGTTL